MAKKSQTGIVPLDDRIIVTRSEAEDQKRWRHHPALKTPKKSPSRAKSRPLAPASCWTAANAPPPTLKEGDIVLFGKYAGTEITVEGEEVIILRESDILAKVG